MYTVAQQFRTYNIIYYTMLSCKERKTRLSQLHTRIQTEWQTYYMNFVKKLDVNTNNLINNISENVDLDFDYVTAHPEYNWDYAILAKNPNMPLDFIIKNVNKFNTVIIPILQTNFHNWLHIFKNNINLTKEFLVDLHTNYNIKLDIGDLMARGFFTKKEELLRIIKTTNERYKYYQLLLHDYTFAEAFEIYTEHVKISRETLLPNDENAYKITLIILKIVICSRHDFDFTYLDKYEAHWFDWITLSAHPKLKVDIIAKHIQNSWLVSNRTDTMIYENNRFSLSAHPCMTIEFIRNNRDLPWCWDELTRTMCPQLIKDNMDLPWRLDNLHSNIKITPEFVLENKFFPWRIRSLMVNFYTHQEYVNYYINNYCSPKLKYLLNITIQQVDSIIKNTTDNILYEPFVINYWKHKFFTEEYRKHIAAYLIQQRWITVYMSPYNPIGEKRLCREYEKYQREHTPEHTQELPQVKN